MCECVPPSQRVGTGVTPHWLTSTNGLAHPDAPTGGGGAGFFRTPGVFAADGDLSALPHPDSPAAAGMDPVQLQQAKEGEEAKVARKPPPLVNADTSEPGNGMTITIESDLHNVAGVNGATTVMVESDGGSTFSGNIGALVFTVVPWNVTIQTRYGTGTPDSDSAYGRGTTPDDIAAGNVTLGFHECCHRQDMLNYLKTIALPTHTGTPKMSVAQANAAVAKYTLDCKAYFAKGRAGSEALTDETATAKVKKSEYDKKNKK
jgi:hypothetical protein